MAIKQLLYVHGAGRQPAASTLKAQIDTLLFGGPQATSRMGYYAHVRWGTAGGGGIAAAPGGSGKARRAAAVRVASDPTLSPKAAAETIATAALARRRTTGIGVAPAAARKEAADLARQLYERADRVARRTSARAGLGIGFPDPIFRIVVGFFASDVIDYLYGGFKAAMRAPVEQALRQGAVPDVIVAHSLGTIITYDVLADPAFAARRPKTLVTVGCPLGIDNVQERLRNGAGRAEPRPVRASSRGPTSATASTRSRSRRRSVTSSARRRTSSSTTR